MEEKIMEAKFKRNVSGYIIGAIGIIITLIGVAESFSAYASYYSKSIYSNYSSFKNYFVECFIFPFNDATIGIWLVYIGILMLVSFGIIMLMMSRCSLSVTSTRVVGKASFGKQVDLPIKQISAIGLGMFNSITVATSAGRVNFWLIENRTEIHNALNDLLASLSSTSKENTEAINSSPVSNADELKKYKDLLDSGAITQEEFDQKKKQLLGL